MIVPEWSDVVLMKINRWIVEWNVSSARSLATQLGEGAVVNIRRNDYIADGNIRTSVDPMRQSRIAPGVLVASVRLHL